LIVDYRVSVKFGANKADTFRADLDGRNTNGLALAQDAAPKIVAVAGKAEILERGRRFSAKEGQRLLAGQSIELVGGGEVRLSSDDGRIVVKVTTGTSVRYDGYVGASSQPWSAGPPIARPAAKEDRHFLRFLGESR
jgi:hypothetical protein